MSSPFALKASTSKAADIPPQGSHQAVLVAIVDLGTHDEKEFGGGEKTRQVRQLFLAWELVAEPLPGGKGNHVVYERYNFSFNSKAKLRQMFEGWLARNFHEGEDFDPTKLLGKTCLVKVSHSTKNDKTYASMSGVGPIMKGMSYIAPVNKPFVWSFADGAFVAPEWLPWCYGQKVEDIISRSHERTGTVGSKPASSPPANGNGTAKPAPRQQAPAQQPTSPPEAEFDPEPEQTAGEPIPF